MTSNICDMVIVGGGIAGLWTLALARSRGYSAILLEKDFLGSGQTLASQGIIHGGSKYALSGSISQATRVITDMPRRWQDAMARKGEVHLCDTRVLSDAQYLVPSAGIDTQLLSFLGSKTMQSHTERITRHHLPDACRQAGIDRAVFRLNECVIDTRSLVQDFINQFSSSLFQHEFSPRQRSDSGNPAFPHRLQLGDNRVDCRYLVLAAGEKQDQLGESQPPMQLRPLQMVMLKDHKLPALYVHFIGRSSKPVLTISAHPCPDGMVWYLGGDLAENGVNLHADDQIKAAQALLRKLLPGVSLSETASFSCLRINRAEPRQGSLMRPDDAFVQRQGTLICGWPTKLALAPRFAELVMGEVTSPPANVALPFLSLPLARCGSLPWEVTDAAH